MIAFSSPRDSRCRSTQLTEAFRRPPTHHLKNGGLLVSTIWSHFLSQSRSSAYSTKQSGKFSALNRSRTDSSLALACALYCSGGWTYSSSRQWTAIWFSEYSSSSEADWVVSAIETSPFSNSADVGPAPPSAGGLRRRSGRLCVSGNCPDYVTTRDHAAFSLLAVISLH